MAGADTNRAIAALALDIKSVERHVAHAYAKIDARNRAEAVAYVLRQPTAATGRTAGAG